MFSKEQSPKSIAHYHAMNYELQRKLNASKISKIIGSRETAQISSRIKSTCRIINKGKRTQPAKIQVQFNSPDKTETSTQLTLFHAIHTQHENWNKPDNWISIHKPTTKNFRLATHYPYRTAKRIPTRNLYYMNFAPGDYTKHS